MLFPLTSKEDRKSRQAWIQSLNCWKWWHSWKEPAFWGTFGILEIMVCWVLLGNFLVFVIFKVYLGHVKDIWLPIMVLISPCVQQVLYSLSCFFQPQNGCGSHLNGSSHFQWETPASCFSALLWLPLRVLALRWGRRSTVSFLPGDVPSWPIHSMGAAQQIS